MAIDDPTASAGEYMLWLEKENKRLKVELDEQRETIDKLPKSADGVRVVPGMLAYAFTNGEIFDIVAVDFYMTGGAWYLQVGVYDICIEDELFAEREAAEAAKEGTSDDDDSSD